MDTTKNGGFDPTIANYFQEEPVVSRDAVILPFRRPATGTLSPSADSPGLSGDIYDDLSDTELQSRLGLSLTVFSFRARTTDERHQVATQLRDVEATQAEAAREFSDNPESYREFLTYTLRTIDMHDASEGTSSSIMVTPRIIMRAMERFIAMNRPRKRQI